MVNVGSNNLDIRKNTFTYLFKTAIVSTYPSEILFAFYVNLVLAEGFDFDEHDLVVVLIPVIGDVKQRIK